MLLIRNEFLFFISELCLIPDEVADPKPPSELSSSSSYSSINSSSSVNAPLAINNSAATSPHGSLVQIISMERHKHPLLERLLDLERLQIDTIREECERRREFRMRVSFRKKVKECQLKVYEFQLDRPVRGLTIDQQT